MAKKAVAKKAGKPKAAKKAKTSAKKSTAKKATMTETTPDIVAGTPIATSEVAKASFEPSVFEKIKADLASAIEIKGVRSSFDAIEFIKRSSGETALVEKIYDGAMGQVRFKVTIGSESANFPTQGHYYLRF